MKIVIMLAAIVCVASDPTPFYDTHAHYSITTIEPLLKMTANYTFSAALNSEKMARSAARPPSCRCECLLSLAVFVTAGTPFTWPHVFMSLEPKVTCS